MGTFSACCQKRAEFQVGGFHLLSNGANRDFQTFRHRGGPPQDGDGSRQLSAQSIFADSSLFPAAMDTCPRPLPWPREVFRPVFTQNPWAMLQRKVEEGVFSQCLGVFPGLKDSPLSGLVELLLVFTLIVVCYVRQTEGI